jgi:hypothetical protein
MKLTKIFATTPQLVSLLHQSDSQLTFGLLDPDTEAVSRLTITADVTVDGEREGLLDWQITPVREPDNLVHVASNGEEFYLQA